MGLVNKGMFDIDQPSWGGWSGRFSRSKVPGFWSRHKDIQVDEKEDTPFYVYREVSDHWVDERDQKVYANNYSPVWRWREAMYNDQICRMDWCVKSFEQANHHPIAAVDGDKANTVLRIKASAGETLKFDAAASTDPDGDSLAYKWWIYEEAGSYAGKIALEGTNRASLTLNLPTGASNSQIHLILEVNDQNNIAPLFDYRRIVVDVDERISPNKPVQK